jgi:NADPH:quinone reductase-like Zn-dependent oxidoreductase
VDQVLVKVRACSLNPVDWHYMRGEPRLMRLGSGWSRPKLPRIGIDLAGVVESVGRNVTQFKSGDEVFGACRGALADYVCTTADSLVLKPAKLSFEQAAAVPVAGLTALVGLRDKGRLQPGQWVLVNGASGGVGTFAVQIARALGAEVLGVCSTRNVDLVRSLGARQVFDYTREDFTQDGQEYDLILDTVGNRNLEEVLPVMTPTGALVLVGGPNDGRWLGAFKVMLRMYIGSWFESQKVHPFLLKLKPGDLATMAELLESGKVTPVIDRTYPLAEVQAAMRYLEEGHARGKVVITLGA